MSTLIGMVFMGDDQCPQGKALQDPHYYPCSSAVAALQNPNCDRKGQICERQVAYVVDGPSLLLFFIWYLVPT